MSKPKLLHQSPQELLKLMDDYYTALYHQLHDPQRPPELAGRISRYFRPTDLPHAR